MLERALLLAALTCFGAFAALAEPIKAVRDQANCHVLEDRPLRQTIIILDEALVRHAPPGSPDSENLRWIRPILDIADVGDGSIINATLPSEQITLYLARSDGNELALAFAGCSPTISDEEMAKRKAEESAIASFFVGGVEHDQEATRERFSDSLMTALGTIAGKAGFLEGQAPPPALLPALANAGRFADLGDGIPRLLLISSFSDIDSALLADDIAARRAALARAAELSFDLQRAEVYVTGVAPALTGKVKPYLEALMLGGRGQLMGLRSDGLPPLAGRPVDVQVYSGTVDMMVAQPSVQIRIARDASGNLVSSWIETALTRQIATPFTGKALCREIGACLIKGDGRWMGQAWNPATSEKVGGDAFSPEFGWSGARFIEIEIAGKEGRVRIWDPALSEIRAPDGRSMPDFRFEVQLAPGLHF